MAYLAWGVAIASGFAAACYLASLECYALAFCCILCAGSYCISPSRKGTKAE